MQRWKRRTERSASAVALAIVLSGCLGATPERARILEARVVRDNGAVALELTQELRFSPTMRDALEHGIPLRLIYKVHGCAADTWQVVELRYAPLTRHYELRRGNETQGRSFARRSAALAALDRVRLRLPREPEADCQGRVQVALDLTSLPTPLRLPAFLDRAQWRLVSPDVPWPTPSSPA